MTNVDYEYPTNWHFYVYKPPGRLDKIEADITKLEGGFPRGSRVWWHARNP